MSLLGLHYQTMQPQQPVSQRLRNSSRSNMTESLLSSFSVSRLSTSSRLSSSSLRSRHNSSHILVPERMSVQLCGMTSSAVAPGTRPVTTALVVRGSTEVLVPQVRVLLAHPVLHVQTMRAMATMMSDLSDQMQLVAPLCV